MTDQQPIIIEDCKEQILINGIWKSSNDHALFHLTHDRSYSDERLFAECGYFDLYINHKVDWGAPIPSTFQEFFPDIMKLLIPADYILMLNIFDPGNDYFDQKQFFSDHIVPSNTTHQWVQKEFNGSFVDTLIFECPLEDLSILRNAAYQGVITEVEGFVMKESSVHLFSKWKSMGNTSVMFRDLVRNTHFAFRQWSDHNGMLIVTDKFDKQALDGKLRDATLLSELTEYIRDFD